MPPVDDDQEGRKCVICQDQLNFLTTLDGCRHTFCFKCIALWRRQQFEERQEPNCPLCRSRIQRLEAGAAGIWYFLDFLHRLWLVFRGRDLGLIDAVQRVDRRLATDRGIYGWALVLVLFALALFSGPSYCGEWTRLLADRASFDYVHVLPGLDFIRLCEPSL